MGKPYAIKNPFTVLTVTAVHSFIASLTGTVWTRKPNCPRPGRSPGEWLALLSTKRLEKTEVFPRRPASADPFEKCMGNPRTSLTFLSRTSWTYLLFAEAINKSDRPD
ncbi:MAG: hypothetical protein ACR2OR_09575 [Hyphomicrobiales bacterium]